jgi:hypothetical protein
MLRSRFPLAPLAAFALLAAVAPVAGAQALAPDSTVHASQPVSSPRAEVAPTPVSVALPTAVGASRVSQSSSAVADEAMRAARANDAGRAVAVQGSRGTGKLYMIVGGAAFLAGAIIGDDAGTIIMIGGAGVGIYGLYLYLQ